MRTGRFFAAAVIGWVMLSGISFGYSGGTGEPNDPYQISDVNDLLELSTDPDPNNYTKYFILMANINLKGVSITPIGDNSTQFSGVFDGANHTISNLFINLPDSYDVGLFGYVSNGGQIKNLNVVNVDIKGVSGVGGLAGRTYSNCSIISCYAAGVVSGYNNVGGLVGINGENGTISFCHAAGTVSSTGNYTGGLAGTNTGTVVSSYASGTVQSTGQHVGGLIGRNGLNTITSSWAEGTVSGYGYIGGLVGYSDGEIKDSHSGGSVHGTGSNNDMEGVGGLVGTCNKNISSCYSDYTVTGTNINVGGLAGVASYTISDSYSIGSITGSSTSSSTNMLVGGLAGRHMGGKIIRCQSSVSVNISAEGACWAGGLTGRTDSSLNITDCCSTGNVTVSSNTGPATAGGLGGAIISGSVTNSYSTGNIFASSKTQMSLAGGLIGRAGMTITNCYSTGNAATLSDINNTTIGGDAGGLAGLSSGTVTNCYSYGEANGSRYSGGLVGYAGGSINRCYSIGKLTGSGIGGLIGYRPSGTVTASFWNTQTSGILTSSGGTGKTTAQMLDISTFTSAGWDFTDSDGNPAIWQIPGQTYPLLIWEDTTVSAIVPDVKGMTQTQGEEEIAAAGLLSSFGSVFSETVPFGEIVSQSPSASDTVIFKTVVVVLVSLGSSNFGGGDGSQENPYRIYTPYQMNNIGLQAAKWTSCFRLMADIDMSMFSGTQYNIIGNSTTPFTGTFDGNGHVIKNLTLLTDVCTGLFGFTNNADIKNLGLENINISNVYKYAGALAGYLEATTVNNCWSSGSISVYGDRLKTACGGGLAGYQAGGVITNSYSTTSLNAYQYEVDAVGGLVGRISSGIVMNCYATGSVSAEPVTRASTGGLAGANVGGSVNGCFWDKETSGQPYSAGGTGRTTVEMKTLSTFISATWDFTTIWTICEGTNYPRLRWQIPAGDWVCPDGVSVEDLDYFVGRWLLDNCTSSNNYCGGGDVDVSGGVDLADFCVFAEHWLEGL